MTRALCSLFAILLMMVNIAQNDSAQRKANLQKERDSLLKEMKLTNQLLKESQKAQQSTLAELNLLREQIALRTRIINSIKKETRILEADIEQNENLIEKKTEELRQMKEAYSKLVFTAYKNNQAQDNLLFIFASDNFYQAWMRSRFLKDLGEYRVEQAESIAKSKVELEERQVVLEEQRASKIALIAEQKAAQAELDANRKRSEAALAELQQDEEGLKGKLAQQQARQKELSQAIEKIIKEELAKAKKENKGDAYALSPEEELSSKSFAMNKGKLPWPLERGLITGRFGEQPHPVLSGITISNNGIDISTDENAMVRAIYAGEVSGVIEIPGAGLAVMVKHGAYRTVYSNLKEALVAKGQMVDTKQNVGVLMTEGGNSEAHLEIWQVTSAGMKKLDPQQWIAR